MALTISLTLNIFRVSFSPFTSFLETILLPHLHHTLVPPLSTTLPSEVAKMPLPAAHLLFIPRELRDQIYSYLSHDITFNYFCRNGRRKGRHTIEARVPNAPCLALLSVCSRTRDEYLESPAFSDLDMTLDATTLTRYDAEKGSAVRRHGLFKYMRNSTLLMTWHQTGRYSFMNFNHWSSFFTSLHLLIPHLYSIRIATYSNWHPIDATSSDWDCDVNLLNDMPCGDLPSAPPGSFAGLELRQVSQCSRIEAPGWQGTSFWSTGDESYRSCHGYRWMSMYVFGAQGRELKWFTAAEALRLIPMVHEGMSKKDALNYSVMPASDVQILQWIEEFDDKIIIADPMADHVDPDIEWGGIVYDHDNWHGDDAYYRNGERKRQECVVRGFEAWFDVEIPRKNGESRKEEKWYDRGKQQTVAWANVEGDGFAAWWNRSREYTSTDDLP